MYGNSTTPVGSLAAPLRSLNRFFFAEETPYGMALARITLPLVLLCDAGYRWAYARELYSTDGALAPLAFNYGFPNFLPEFSASIAVGLHTALIFVLVSSCIGWCTRFSLCAATLLYFYFGMLDSLSTMTKYSVIATHGMVLLSLSQAGTVWSVDAWLKGNWRRKPGPAIPPCYWAAAPVWPQRLLQILVGVVYLGAAMTKMHTPAFFSGDQILYWMMTNVNYSHPFGEYLTQYPGIVLMSGYVSIIWEILFSFCSWRGWSRILMVSLGVMFHVMTLFMLGLTIFPMVMFAIYLAFLNEEDVQWIGYHLRRGQRKLLNLELTRKLAGFLPLVSTWRTPRVSRLASAAAFCGMLGVVCFAAAEFESRSDYYGMRRPQGPHTLRELSAEEVQVMLAPETPLREQDKFNTFDIGNLFIGERLCNQVSQFRQFERIYCEANLNPPHEDMWIECNLHDSQDRCLTRVGQVLPREKLRGHFNYLLNDGFDPGEYSLVLRSRGKEVMRRSFTLLPALRSPVAN